MALKWADVSSSEKYKSAAPEVKVKMQNAYFDRYVTTAPGYNPEWEPKIRQKLFATEPIKVPEKKPVSTFAEAGKATLRGVEGIFSGIGATTKWLGDTIALQDGVAPVFGAENNRTIREKAQYAIGKKIGELGETASKFWKVESQRGIEAPDPATFQGSFMKNPSWARGVAAVAESIPSLAYATAITFATKNPTLGAAALGLTEGAGQYEEARAAGKSMKYASTIGVLSTAGNTILETIPLTRFMKGGEGKIAKDMFIGAVQEGSEEVAQALWSNTLAKIGYEKTRDLTEGMVEGFIGGAGSGGIIGGFTSGRGVKLDEQIDEAVKAGVKPEEIEAMQEMVKNQIVNNADKIDAVLTESAKTLNTKLETVFAEELDKEMGKLINPLKFSMEESKKASKTTDAVSPDAQIDQTQEKQGNQGAADLKAEAGSKEAVSADLQPLVEESKKYKSADEFATEIIKLPKSDQDIKQEDITKAAEEGLGRKVFNAKEAVKEIKDPTEDQIIKLNNKYFSDREDGLRKFYAKAMSAQSQKLSAELKQQISDVIDRSVFKETVAQSIQDDGQKVINASNRGDIATLEKIQEKYVKDKGIGENGSGVGPGKVKKPRPGAVAVWNAAQIALEKLKPAKGSATKSPVLALQLNDGQIISDPDAKLHSDIKADFEQVKDVGILDEQGNYIPTKKPDNKGGEPLESLPEVPADVLEKARQLVPSGNAFAKQSIFWEGTIPIEEGADYYKLKAIDTPELIRLARELTGMYPTVVRKTGNAVGRFYSKTGHIKIIADLFKQGNEQQAAIVLAHEIGHLVDWLPDNTLKRGNLLGRLLSLKEFRNTIIVSEEPVNIKQVTNEATKEVLKETGHTFSEMVTGNLPSDIKDKIKARYTEKITQMGGIKDKDIKAELIKVTQYMHPFDISSSEADYVSYRLSSKELYAEALSLLLNSPGTMEKMAPKFTKLFIENLDKKPEVKQAYFDMLELFNGERADVLEGLDKDIRRMFAKADPLRSQKLAQKKVAKVSVFDRLRQAVDNKYAPILKKVENIEKMGTTLSPSQNPRYILEEYAMLNNPVYEWCLKIDKGVTQQIVNNELSELDLGVYTFLKRIVGRPAEAINETQEFDDVEIQQFANQFTDRKDMANPLGVNPQRAQEQLDYLKTNLGDEKFAKLEEIATNFHNLVFEVVEEAVALGSYNKQVFEERIKPNKETYVSFGVINYMQNYVSAGVKKQMGTLNEIENPFITTILKTISLIRLNEKQRAVSSVRDMLKSYFPSEIKESKKLQRDGITIFLDSQDSGRVQMFEDGRMASYDVDPYIAKSLEYDPTDMSREIGQIINTMFGNNIFKQLYITYNPGFAFAFNPIRDFKRTYKTLEATGRGVSIRRLLVEYAKNLPTAYRKLNGINDDLITEMIANRALEINFDEFVEAYTDRSLSYSEILKRYGLARSEEEISKIRKNFIVKGLVKTLEFIRFHGAALESISKIAGYNILKSKDVFPAERAYITRNYIGTPNFRNKGLVTDTTNSIFMFSNIMKEGLKSDFYLATNPKTRSGYWWATAKMDLLPKLLMVLASSGLLGMVLKNFFDKVSEYDKTNYIIIPLGTHNDKAVYARIPHDETGRLISALFWKTASALQGKPESLQQIFAFGAGQLPNVAPGMKIASGWISYLSGKNPYDDFRGREVISEREWEAGGWQSLKKMIQWTSNQTGQLSFTTYSKESNSTFESVMQVLPIVNRLIKVSDFGITEELRKVKDEVKQDNARKSLLKQEAIKKGADLINKGSKAIDVLREIKKTVYGSAPITDNDARLLIRGLTREVLKDKEDDPFVDSLIYATTNEEKKRIIIRMRQDYSAPDFKNKIKTLYQFKIIGDNVMTLDEWKELVR